MARTMQVDPLSVVLGVALTAACLVTMSQVMVSPSQLLPLSTPCAMHPGYGPHARDMIQVTSSAPFVVPSGKALVITALGLNRAEYPGVHSASLFVDGEEALVGPWPGTAATPSMTAIPTGLSVAPGSAVMLVPSHPAFIAQAWGYLADADGNPTHGVPHYRVHYEPLPSEMVTITGGAPVTVPLGKVFMLTALVRTSNTVVGTIGLKMNGDLVCSAPNRNGVTQTAFHEIASGFTARQGSILEVEPAAAGFQAWGYLADE